MRIDILTLFPDMCKAVYSESIIGRALSKGIIEIHSHNIRDFTQDKHKRVDDSPYGGGMGMLMQAQPIYDCYKSVCDSVGKKTHLIYLSPQGTVLTQKRAVELSKLDNITLLCGHYEGIDERVLEEIVDEEISIGDFVLTGGELPALVLIDCIARMVDGVLPNEEAFSCESHYSGLLEHPQYTKPYEWNGIKVPDVLISGHHANIEKWKREQSLKRTFERRPDLLENASLSDFDRKFLDNLKNSVEDLD
ncbi:MAG: tRNA (guanosine(37)-N1)-methyltransferase TrmD [Clostridia bacterium]|nr:tRNA (guanosine(37)-N1)-methyltransferase TrmD [Clostridia bacterium]